MLAIVKCASCAPDEWPGPPPEHNCAADDEDRLYGTVVYTVPRHDSSLHDRYVVQEWPVCPQCKEEYCTWCGCAAWCQCL
jgi:hypothetical protein